MAFINPVRRYTEKKIIGYTKEQLFDVVAAVEHYHKFVPACRRSDILERHEDHLKAKLEIASCIEGVLFKSMETRWIFEIPPYPELRDKACLVDFSVNFEFKSMITARLASAVFDEMVRLNINAFVKRSEQLYGPATTIHQLKSMEH